MDIHREWCSDTNNVDSFFFRFLFGAYVRCLRNEMFALCDRMEGAGAGGREASEAAAGCWNGLHASRAQASFIIDKCGRRWTNNKLVCPTKTATTTTSTDFHFQQLPFSMQRKFAGCCSCSSLCFFTSETFPFLCQYYSDKMKFAIYALEQQSIVCSHPVLLRRPSSVVCSAIYPHDTCSLPMPARLVVFVLPLRPPVAAAASTSATKAISSWLEFPAFYSMNNFAPITIFIRITFRIRSTTDTRTQYNYARRCL